MIERRRLLRSAAAGAGTLTLSGCDRLSHADWFVRMLDSAAWVNQRVQALLTPPGAHGRLYTEADISQNFRSNGTHHPNNPEYQALASKDFVDWRLEIGGLVDRPMGLSLKDIRAMPSVTQITRHDCVEGWSCIGKWTGVPLRGMLASAGVQKRARYAVFFCYDTLPGASEPYYESIALDQVNLPETILAYEMNNQTLSIPYGAPLRLRLGRQLGYKMAKYLRRIETGRELHPHRRWAWRVL